MDFEAADELPGAGSKVWRRLSDEVAFLPAEQEEIQDSRMNSLLDAVADDPAPMTAAPSLTSAASPTASTDVDTPHPDALVPTPSSSARLWKWLGIVALLILLGQQIYAWVGMTLQNPTWRPFWETHCLQLAYYTGYHCRLAPLTDPSQLRFTQHQLEYVQGSQRVVLHLEGSLRNMAAFTQGLPILRVHLQDRYGNDIKRQDFAPRDYSANFHASTLAPGRSIKIRLALTASGSQPAGYYLEFMAAAIH